MDVATQQVTVREIGIPADDADPDFRTSIDIGNAVEADLLGHHLLDDSYADAFPQWQQSEYHEARRFLGLLDGVPVGRAYLGLPTQENLEKYWLVVVVLPEHRGRGIGSALLAHVEAIVAQLGRSVGQAFATSPATDGATLSAKTGFGSVAADAPGTRFLLRAGFVLEQAERISQLDLGREAARFTAALQSARIASEPDYRLVLWRGLTPDAHLDDLAWMHSRMSTDTPQGELALDEEVWDAARVKEAEQRSLSDDRFLLTAAAEHVATGRLVAYSVLSVPVAAGRAAWQEDTLVVREHRGHRLGMLVKAANLLELTRQQPDVPAVFTWNAEENRPMLDVNEALGFRAVGYEGMWQRLGSAGQGALDNLA